MKLFFNFLHQNDHVHKVPDYLRADDPVWARMLGWLVSVDPCLCGKRQREACRPFITQIGWHQKIRNWHVQNNTNDFKWPRLRLHEKNWPRPARLVEPIYVVYVYVLCRAASQPVSCNGKLILTSFSKKYRPNITWHIGPIRVRLLYTRP